jgi:hypothetical protein
VPTFTWWIDEPLVKGSREILAMRTSGSFALKVLVLFRGLFGVAH